MTANKPLVSSKSVDNLETASSSGNAAPNKQLSKSVVDVSKSKEKKTSAKDAKPKKVVAPKDNKKVVTPKDNKNVDQKEIKLAKEQEKKQQKLEKQRLAEQKKQEKKQNADALKAKKETAAKELKLKKEKEKAEKDQLKKQEKGKTNKTVTTNPLVDNNIPQVRITNPLAQSNAVTQPSRGQNYSTNTLESSISRSSGPPPYTSEAVPNQQDSTGNTSFSKPINESENWDFISQHRQQMNRPAKINTTSKLKGAPLSYNVGKVSVSVDEENSEA